MDNSVVPGLVVFCGSELLNESRRFVLQTFCTDSVQNVCFRLKAHYHRKRPSLEHSWTVVINQLSKNNFKQCRLWNNLCVSWACNFNISFWTPLKLKSCGMFCQLWTLVDIRRWYAIAIHSKLMHNFSIFFLQEEFLYKNLRREQEDELNTEIRLLLLLLLLENLQLSDCFCSPAAKIK